MGTPDFAVESLQLLVENNYNIVGVITAPDRKAGRGLQVMESAVKKYAVANSTGESNNSIVPIRFKRYSML